MSLALAGIHRYPVKSCRGESLSQGVIEPWGLAGDRRWMVIDDDGKAVTARTHPQLLLVRPELFDGGLRLSRAGAAPVTAAEPTGVALCHVEVWKSEFLAAPAEGFVHVWLSAVVGISVRLVYLDDPTRRRTDPAFSLSSDRVGFADSYPLLATTTASLAALNELIMDGPQPPTTPLEMARFRPNLVISGSPAWSEDSWRRIRIGQQTFRAVKGCSRCVLTTIDPQTTERGNEPLATLSRHRKWDGRIWFGMNLIPDLKTKYASDRTLTVGAEVEIVETAHSDGPPR